MTISLLPKRMSRLNRLFYDRTRSVFHPGFSNTYKRAQNVFYTAELGISSTISQWFHWQCVLITQSSFVNNIRSQWITITNRLSVRNFNACGIYWALTTSFWSVSCTTPVIVYNSITVSPRRKGCEWGNCTSMLDRLCTICWDICQSLKSIFCIRI